MSNIPYENISDEELVDRYHNGEEPVMEYLLKKHEKIVKGLAYSMYAGGATPDDLLQEGMIGLYKAVRDYDNTKGASFTTFAYLCVKRQLDSAVLASNRLKNTVLNNSTSITEEDYKGEVGVSPEQEVLDKERLEILYRYLDENLSSFEKEVFELKASGMDYKKIAEELEKTPKSVDNAISRIKSKLNNFID